MTCDCNTTEKISSFY